MNKEGKLRGQREAEKEEGKVYTGQGQRKVDHAIITVDSALVK